MKKKTRYKLTSLVITKIFCQSLGPLLYPGCTVLNFIYLFFKKWGGGGGFSAPPAPPPVQALFNMCHENIGKRNCCLCAHCNTVGL